MKNIPKIRFPEFSGEWVEKKLGEVCGFFKGKGISKSDVISEKCKVKSEKLRIENGELRKCIRYGELYTTYQEIIKEVKNYTKLKDVFLSKKGDVLIPSSGETAEDISTASCIMKDNIAIGGDINVLRCKINGEFLAYYLKHKKQKEIAKLAQGISVVHIYSKSLKSLKIHIPPTLAEQQKIASFLSSIDEKIDIISKKIEKLKEYKKGIMQKLLNVKNGVPELRFTEFSGEWIEKRLGEVLYEVKKEKIPKSKLTNYEVLSIKLHTKGLEKTGKKPNITEKGRPYFLVETGDILIGKQNFHNGSIGIVTDEYVNMVTSNAIFHLREKGIEKKFIFYYLGRKDFYKRVEYLLGGTGQKEISKTEFFNLKIIIPPTIEEQQKIASFLSSIDEKIELNEQVLDKMKEYKRGLLQKMFV